MEMMERYGVVKVTWKTELEEGSFRLVLDSCGLRIKIILTDSGIVLGD